MTSNAELSPTEEVGTASFTDTDDEDKEFEVKLGSSTPNRVCLHAPATVMLKKCTNLKAGESTLTYLSPYGNEEAVFAMRIVLYILKWDDDTHRYASQILSHVDTFELWFWISYFAYDMGCSHILPKKAFVNFILQFESEWIDCSLGWYLAAPTAMYLGNLSTVTELGKALLQNWCFVRYGAFLDYRWRSVGGRHRWPFETAEFIGAMALGQSPNSLPTLETILEPELTRLITQRSNATQQ